MFIYTQTHTHTHMLDRQRSGLQFIRLWRVSWLSLNFEVQKSWQIIFSWEIWYENYMHICFCFSFAVFFSSFLILFLVFLLLLLWTFNTLFGIKCRNNRKRKTQNRKEWYNKFEKSVSAIRNPPHLVLFALNFSIFINQF